MRATISSSDLAHHTEDILDRVHREALTLVHHGEEQIVLLDVEDYRLLRALAACATRSPVPAEIADDCRILNDYLAERISLGKAAELLQTSRFELKDRFERLGLPVRLGPSSVDDARAEVAAARRLA